MTVVLRVQRLSFHKVEALLRKRGGFLNLNLDSFRHI